MSQELNRLTDEGVELLIASLRAQRDEIRSDYDQLFRVMGAMIASAGEQGITLTPETLVRNYEVTRFDNPQSLTITFTAKEK